MFFKVGYYYFIWRIRISYIWTSFAIFPFTTEIFNKHIPAFELSLCISSFQQVGSLMKCFSFSVMTINFGQASGIILDYPIKPMCLAVEWGTLPSSWPPDEAWVSYQGRRGAPRAGWSPEQQSGLFGDWTTSFFSCDITVSTTDRKTLSFPSSLFLLAIQHCISLRVF